MVLDSNKSYVTFVLGIIVFGGHNIKLCSEYIAFYINSNVTIQNIQNKVLVQWYLCSYKQNRFCILHSAGGTDTPEYQKLQVNYDTVIYHLGAAQVAEELADKLYANKLITREMAAKANLPTRTDTEKMRDLILAVLAQVELEPANYHKFVQILSSISGAEDIVKHLRL